MITEHTVCSLPADHPWWRYYALKVQRRGSLDQWVVQWAGSYLLVGGPEPEWVGTRSDASQFNERGALAAAEDLAPDLVVAGRTVGDAMREPGR